MKVVAASLMWNIDEEMTMTTTECYYYCNTVVILAAWESKMTSNPLKIENVTKFLRLVFLAESEYTHVVMALLK